MSGIRIGGHAIDRWVERVEPMCNRAQATRSVAMMVEEGNRSEKPRRWLAASGQRARAGVTFVYWHRRPGVALLIEDKTVLTVLVRDRTHHRFNYERVRRAERDRKRPPCP